MPSSSRRPSAQQLWQHLRELALFRGLDDAILHELATGARWREVGEGEIVVLEGEAVSSLYYLQYGWLKVVKTSVAGREQILRFLEPNDTFNEVGVFSDLPNPATVIALEPAGIWLIPRDLLIRLLAEHPAFSRHVIAKLAERMLHLVSLVTDLSLRSVMGRLARLLLDSATNDVLHRPGWYTQSELAARLGTVPDVVQRALRTLENDRLITVDRQQIRILDRTALADLAQ